MKNKHALFLFATLLPMLAQGQYLQNYTATSWQGEWQSISQTGTLLASVTGDYGTQTLALPFDFMFGQSDYPQGTTVTVRADGFVVMRGSSSSHNALAYWNQPSSSIISPFPLRDGQLTGTGSGCWWQLTTDDNGEQMLVIEWRGLHRYPTYPITQAETDLDDFNYQLRLHENGDISAVYGHMQSGVPSDSLFNFILTDGATMTGAYMDQNSLRGTWDSVVACSACSPGYRQGNNWVMFAANNLAGCPDSGTVVTWHRPQPPCPRPTAIAVSAIAHDTALLSWTPNEVTGSFVRIQWDTADFTPGTAGHHLQLYGGDTMHLSGLAPNHPHWLYMRSDCGEDSSAWHGVQFTTPCAPLSHDELPFNEDFEGCSEGYTSLWGGCSGNTVYVKDMQALEGRPNMAFRGSNIAWFHLPPVDSVRTTVLHFSGHGPFGGTSNPSATVQVGVMDDPFDITSLQVLQTFTVNQNAWEEHTVPMATYSGQGNTVAIKWTASNWFFLDDLSLEVYEGCLPVERVTAVEVGQHTALVDWGAYVPAGSYRVVWYPAGQEWQADSTTTAADSLLLTGLDANTDYVVAVRSLCSDTSVSEAVSITFRTRCAVPLPLAEDFDAVMALPDCWGATSMTTRTSTGSYTPAVPLLVGQGDNHVVQFSSQYTSYYNYERGILLLPFVDTVVNRLRLTFDYRVERFPQLMSLMVGVISGDDNIADFIPVATIEPQDSLWHTYTVETGAVPIAEGRLVMMQHSTGSHDYVPGYWRDLGYVDNVQIEVLPACDRPAAVWLSHITSTTAEVHWLENNGLGTYLVNCDGTDYTVVGDSVLLLTGLIPSNSYTVRVSRLCDGMYTDYRTATFTTACQPIDQLPWHENFEMWTLGEIDNCWLRYCDPHEGSEVKASGNSYTENDMGMRVLEMEASNYTFDAHSYDALAVMPETGVALEGLALGLRVACPYSQPSNLVLELGLMEDGGDSGSFRPIDTVPVTASWSYHEYAFAPADSGRLALRLKAVNGGGRLMIDDLALFPATDCLRPSALMVDTVTQRTATLVVSDTAGVGNYRYYWREYASHADASDSVDATDTVTLTNLLPGTYYVASVAVICSDGTLSNIVYTEFYTDCDTLLHADLPHVETFNSGSLSHCWSTLPTGADVTFNTYYRRGATGYSLCLTNSSNSTQTYAVLPVVDTLAGLDLTFWVHPIFSSYHPGITVGVMSNPGDASTFVPVQSFDLSQNSGWTEYQVSLGSHSTLGHHIALRPDRGDSTGFVTIVVDDLTISESLPCERPDSVTVDSIGATGAVLTIADGGNNRHYMVTVASAHYTTSFVADFDSNDNIYRVTLTGLTPATAYTVSVSSICYDSSITFPVNTQFVTQCAPMPLPWRQDFEEETVGQLPRCWETQQGTARVVNGDTKCLYARTDTSAAWMDVVTPELAFGEDSTRIVFYLKARQGYSDSNYHYHLLDTRLQLFASADDSLTLLYDDSIAYHDNWELVSLHTAPLPYGARLLFRLWRTAGSTGAVTMDLDELKVQSLTPAPHCDGVADLAASDIGYTSATVSWTPQGNESRWELYLRGDGTNLTTVVDSTRVTFTDLAHTTTFACLVRPLCNDSLTGPWSDTLHFTTSACEPIEDILVSGITATTATITWRHAEGQHRWLLNYGPADFLQGEGTTVEVEDTASYTIEGLSPQTGYDVYLRALCDEGHQSVWSIRVSFNTSTEGITLAGENALLTVYPNPFRESVKIKTDGDRLIAAVLIDMQGRPREVRLTEEGPGQYTLDLEGFPQGTYLLTFTSGEGWQTAVRLIKENDR